MSALFFAPLPRDPSILGVKPLVPPCQPARHPSCFWKIALLVLCGLLFRSIRKSAAPPLLQSLQPLSRSFSFCYRLESMSVTPFFLSLMRAAPPLFFLAYIDPSGESFPIKTCPLSALRELFPWCFAEDDSSFCRVNLLLPLLALDQVLFFPALS